MDSIFLVIGVAIVLIIALVLILARSAGSDDIPVVKKAMLTKRERAALEAIEAAFPNSRVYPQVAMGALLQPKKGLSAQRRSAVRNRFAQKIVDFVVEDRSNAEVRFLVEVDDRTHDASKDRQRDALTSAAGYQTVRIPAGAKLDVASIRALCGEITSATKAV